MAVSKVVYGGQTLIDITSDTVSPNKLLQGATAHNAAGNSIEGVVPPYTYGTTDMTPGVSDLAPGALYFYYEDAN